MPERFSPSGIVVSMRGQLSSQSRKRIPSMTPYLRSSQARCPPTNKTKRRQFSGKRENHRFNFFILSFAGDYKASPAPAVEDNIVPTHLFSVLASKICRKSASDEKYSPPSKPYEHRAFCEWQPDFAAPTRKIAREGSRRNAKRAAEIKELPQGGSRAA
jgi:hypothetical protein